MYTLHPPIDQFTAELIFQCLDVPAEGRLRDVAAFGGARKSVSVGQDEEIFNPLDLHAFSRPGRADHAFCFRCYAKYAWNVTAFSSEA